MGKILTNKEFIEKSKKIHGEKYDYSKVNYINGKTKVIIICPIHGEFEQLPGVHMSGHHCPKCASMRRKEKLSSNTEEFIKKAKLIHGDKYNYSKVVYKGNRQKVTIICPIHGEFQQTPFCHLQNNGCPKCGTYNKSNDKSRKGYKIIKYTTDSFIEKAKSIHGDKYDYSKTVYISKRLPVTIICPIHGEFKQTPEKHLIGHGCQKCGIEKVGRKNALTTEEFIRRSKEKFGDKLSYELVEYKDNQTQVTLICPIHGEFKQLPTSHLQSILGCPMCGVDDRSKKTMLDVKDFISTSNEVHNNFYDYTKVEYKGNSTNVEIICPKHGSFLQTPYVHMKGCGCPKCAQEKMTSKIEEKTKNKLISNNILFEEQKKFDWLYYKGKLKLDFYLPDYNIAIECQGGQHFASTNFFGGNENFENAVKRDIVKYEKCKANGIKILYVLGGEVVKWLKHHSFPSMTNRIYHQGNVFYTIDEIINHILNHKNGYE